MPESFHFLRAEWLVALAPTILLYLVLSRSSSERRWRRVIAPHLLEHLKVGGEGRFRPRPLHWVTLVLTLGSIAMAGPTWERERSPFSEDTAPLVVALDLSASMNAIDVQPTRLDRAKQKIRDLLELRADARTALIAYAGSAHTVLPLSDDASILETFLGALATDVMPTAGKEPVRALELAESLLSREETPGSILFLTDGIAAEHVPSFVEQRERSKGAVLVLALGTREGGPIRTGENQFAVDASGRRMVASLDVEGLEALASATGAYVASATVGSDDVERIARRIQRNLQEAQEEDETARWRDFGYYVTFPLVLLGMLGFRRGWTVRWSAVALLVTGIGCSVDVWLTPDQQGRRFFERGEYAEAAERFEDPLWSGVALYRSGDWSAAVSELARSESPEAYYDLGNAYARLGSYEEAASAYEVALEAHPNWREAQQNLELVRSLIAVEPEAEEPPPGGDPTFDADEVRFDEKGEKGTRGEVERSLLSEEQIAEMWMRRLSTSPADFLRRRFALEASGR